MFIYRTKTKKLEGAHWRQVSRKAMIFYKDIKSRTKRRPYVKSAYFNKQKIFLGLFWSHLHEKLNLRDKTRRIKFFPCAIELISKSRFAPTSRDNPNNPETTLHRFTGQTSEGEIFFVQIKENKKSGEKWLLSVFPEN